MSEVNKHGLARDIPDPVKRQVRQRCGFGCVVCGQAIYQYEHFDPDFADARDHDPQGITLLCGKCHDYVTRGLWSKDLVRAHDKEPVCKQKGFSFGAFDVGREFPEIWIGPVHAIRTFNLLEVEGKPLFRIDPPEEQGAPFRVSALFCGPDGRELVRIENNEWKCPTSTWDVEVVGARIVFRTAAREIPLVIRSEPPKRLVIERLNMSFGGARIAVNEPERKMMLKTRGQCKCMAC